jgi:hypothetical protein
MPFRKGHGQARKLGQTLVWEQTPLDEMPSAPKPPTLDPKAGRDAKGRIASGDKARELARLRHIKPDFVRVDVAAAPEFEPFNRRRKELVRKRVSELHAMYGDCSAGVGMILRAWGWATAFGEFMASKAAETADLDLMAQSGQVLARASVELAKAYELAGKEAASRPRENPRDRIAREIREQKAAAARAALPAPNPTRKDDSDGRNDS